MPAPEPLLSRLREVRDVLMFSFDFELLEAPLGPEDYATPAPWLPAFVVPGALATVIARDAMGGVYLSCEFSTGRAARWVHLDTRGHVVALGNDLEQVIALIVAIPYWHQLLLECPSGTLDAMREVALRLDREVNEDLPALADARQYLLSLLDLPVFADPVRHLHDQVFAPGGAVTVLSPHGWRYESPIARATPAVRSDF
jgi:hypothetical protein